MSRNLCRTSCCFCPGVPVAVEAPRLITEADAGPYFQEYKGMTVAHAECPECEAKYLAWLKDSPQWCSKYGRPAEGDGVAPFDLSFRSTFNDEPDAQDLPTYSIEVVTKLIRTPWAFLCSKCGGKLTSAGGYCRTCEEHTT